MRCNTCDTDTDVRYRECDRCRTPVGVPALEPGARIHPVQGIGRAAAVAVGAATLALLLTVVVQLVIALLAERAGASTDGEEFLLTAGLLELGAGLAHSVAFLAAVVLVIVWTWRARNNLDAFPGAGATLSRNWAIAGWLVPFVNFVVPYRVVANIARESLWRLGTPWLVILWWAAWLGYLFTDRVISRSATAEFDALPYPQTAADLQAYADYYAETTGAYLLPTVAYTVAGVSLIVLIHRISAAQTARIARAMPAGQILPGMTVPMPAPTVDAPRTGAVEAPRTGAVEAPRAGAVEASAGPAAQVPPAPGGAGGTIGA